MVGEADFSPEETPESPALADLLLQPMGEDDPQRRVVRQDLEARLAHEGLAGKGDDTPKQARAWLMAGRKPRGRRGMLLAVLFLWLGCAGLEIYVELPLLGAQRWAPPLVKELALRQIHRCDPEKAPYDPTLDGDAPLSGAERGWRSHPNDPASYATYVEQSLAAAKALPPGYDATWRRLDPDNGLWLLYRADMLRSRTPARDEEALETIRKAAAMPRLKFHTYEQVCQTEAGMGPPQTAVAMGWLMGGRYLLSERMNWIGSYLEQRVFYHVPSRIPYREIYEKVDRAAKDDEKLRKEAYDPGMLRKFRLPWMAMLARRGLLESAACLILVAAALGWRALPSTGPAAKLAGCVAALWKPRDAWRIAGAGLALPMVLGGVLYAIGSDLRHFSSAPFELVPVPFLLMAVTLAVAFTGKLLGRRAGFLGMAPTSKRRWIHRLAAALASLAVLILIGSIAALIFGWVRKVDTMTAVLDGGLKSTGALAGLVVLWLLVRVMLGYASPEVNLRHRVMARVLEPACLAMAAILCTAALVMHPVERMMVPAIPLLKTTH